MADDKPARLCDARAVAGRNSAETHLSQRRASGLIALSLACLLAACGDSVSHETGPSSAANAASSDEPRGAQADEAAIDAASGEVDSGAPAPSGPPFSFEACPGVSELTLPPGLPACDGEFKCGGESHCYPVSGANLAIAPDCSTGKCLPDRAAATQGRLIFRQCDGSGGPGVCVPHCFALTRTWLSVFFPRGEAGCGAEEMCIPCISPLDGSPSGACDSRCGGGPG